MIALEVHDQKEAYSQLIRGDRDCAALEALTVNRTMTSVELAKHCRTTVAAISMNLARMQQQYLVRCLRPGAPGFPAIWSLRHIQTP